MGFVVWGWAQGRFTTGDVVLVNTWLSQLFRPLDLLGMVYRTIRQGLIDMKAMFDLIDTPAEVVDVPHAPPLVVAAGEVRFEDVRFGYEPAREILHGVSFTVPAGGTVAVVGPSGAGKSTLARLRKFVVEFLGSSMATLPSGVKPEAVVTASRGQIVNPFTEALTNDVPGHWRAIFDLKADAGDPVELRLFLRVGEQVLTETWAYQCHVG